MNFVAEVIVGLLYAKLNKMTSAQNDLTPTLTVCVFSQVLYKMRPGAEAIIESKF